MTQQMPERTAQSIYDDMSAGKCSRALAIAAADRRGLTAEFLEIEKRDLIANNEMLMQNKTYRAIHDYYADREIVERALNM